MTAPSDIIPAAKQEVQKLVTQAQELAHREPKQVSAALVGLALGSRLFPTRLVFRTLALAAGALARPALLALGAMKAYELYRSNSKST